MGGVVFELDSMDMVLWLKAEKAAFVVSLGGTSVVKDRVVSVIVEYVPTNHNPDTFAENKKTKQVSGLNAGTLVSMRWIKPIQRCMAGKCTTHLITWFQLTGAANHVICDGIVIAGKRAWAR